MYTVILLKLYVWVKTRYGDDFTYVIKYILPRQIGIFMLRIDHLGLSNISFPLYPKSRVS